MSSAVQSAESYSALLWKVLIGVPVLLNQTADSTQREGMYTRLFVHSAHGGVCGDGFADGAVGDDLQACPGRAETAVYRRRPCHQPQADTTFEGLLVGGDEHVQRVDSEEGDSPEVEYDRGDHARETRGRDCPEFG